jgi:hypothetical protein
MNRTGTIALGTFSGITWENGPFIETQVDVTGFKLQYYW